MRGARRPIHIAPPHTDFARLTEDYLVRNTFCTSNNDAAMNVLARLAGRGMAARKTRMTDMES